MKSSSLLSHFNWMMCSPSREFNKTLFRLASILSHLCISNVPNATALLLIPISIFLIRKSCVYSVWSIQGNFILCKRILYTHYSLYGKTQVNNEHNFFSRYLNNKKVFMHIKSLLKCFLWYYPALIKTSSQFVNISGLDSI